MLWTIFVILLVLWLLGLVSSYTLGGFADHRGSRPRNAAPARPDPRRCRAEGPALVTAMGAWCVRSTRRLPDPTGGKVGTSSSFL